MTDEEKLGQAIIKADTIAWDVVNEVVAKVSPDGIERPAPYEWYTDAYNLGHDAVLGRIASEMPNLDEDEHDKVSGVGIAIFEAYLCMKVRKAVPPQNVVPFPGGRA